MSDSPNISVGDDATISSVDLNRSGSISVESTIMSESVEVDEDGAPVGVTRTAITETTFQPISGSSVQSPAANAEEEEESTSSVYQRVSGFRPPSPTNVIQLLDRIQLPTTPNDSSLPVGLKPIQIDTPAVAPVTPPATPHLPASKGMLPRGASFVGNEVRAKKLGAMRVSDAEMLESIVPSRDQIAPKVCGASNDPLSDRASSVPFIVPTLFKYFEFYQQEPPKDKKKGRSLSSLLSPGHSAETSRNTPSSSGRSISREASGLVGTPTDSPAESSPPTGSAPQPSPLMRTVVNKDPHELSASEHALLLRDLMHEYVDIYFENPRSFSPFYKKRHDHMTRAEQAKMIYSHMKNETSEKNLQALFHKLKPKMVQHFEFILEEKSLVVARLLPKLLSANGGTGTRCLNMISMMQTGDEEYLAEVNRVVESLRHKCMSIFSLINQRFVVEIFPNYDEIHDYETLNERILGLLFEPEINAAVKDYHSSYQRAASSFPGRILYSSLFRNRIESRSHFDSISFNDLVVAVEESTGHLRSTIHGFMRIHPDLLIELFNTPPEKVISSSTGGIAPTPEITRLGKVYRLSGIGWLHASRIYTKLFTPGTTTLVKKLRVSDPIVFRMISENKFQEALWRLLDTSQVQQAAQLEDWITKYVLQSEFIISSRTLGGGFTTTKIVTIEPDDMEIPGIMSHAAVIYGVFKPKPKVSIFSLQSMKDGIVSNHRKEVAAYRIDKLLHLHHVPLTKSILYEEHEGSIQYFISDVVAARDLNEVNIDKPKRSGKFGKAKGERSVLPRSIQLFDWLIDNRDRNLDNYLISTVDQRHILIDHSWTWTTPLIIKELDSHDKTLLTSLIPNRIMYGHVKFLSQHHELIDRELVNLLSKSNIDAFKHRLELFVKFVEGEITKQGESAVFEVPNREDRRTYDLGREEDNLDRAPSFDKEGLEPMRRQQSASSSTTAASC